VSDRLRRYSRFVRSGARHTVRRVVTSILVATLGAVEPSGQRQGISRGGGSGSTSRPLSATVFASWSMHWSNTDGSTMAVLILWRGSPGWFTRGASSGGSGGGSSGAGGSGSGYSYQWLSQGGLTFSIEFDIERRIVKLLDREFDLTHANVVLVDRVDASDGPTIAGTRWVEPTSDVAPAADAIETTIKHSPELFDYLQCHVPPPPPPAPIPPETQTMITSMIAAMCERMRP
jgi:hypothetical protein